jgi:hypothetical protein
MSNSTKSTTAVAALFWTNMSNDVNYWAFVLAVCIGVPFNLVVIVIFWRLMKNKTNMGFLGICQSTIDVVVLLYMLLIFRSSSVFNVNVANTSDFNCRILSYLRRIVLHASSWMTVLITFDRFIYIMYSHGNRFEFMKKKIYLASIMLSILLGIAIVDIPNLFFYLNKANSCTASADITLTTNLETICLRTYFPFLCMVIFNVTMVRSIFKKNQRAFQGTSLSRKEYQFTLAVMAYNIYFFVFNFPLSVWYILNSITTYLDSYRNDSVGAAKFNFIGNLTIGLADFIQTFSIISHLIFNKLFRQELFSLIQSIVRIIFPARIYPDQTSALTNTKAT